MNKMKWLWTALLLVLVPAAAQAQTIYHSESDFLATSGAVFSPMQSFESLANGGNTTLISVPSFTMSTSTAVLNVEAGNILGAHATDGVQYVRWAAPASGILVFTFTSPVNAFGMTLTDAVDAGGHALSLSIDGGVSFLSGLTGGLPSGEERFLGVISDTAFTSLQLRHTGPAADGIGIDEVRFGTVTTPVPEPETYAMLLVGLGLLAWTRRRRLPKPL